jgi:hypothetical protein
MESRLTKVETLLQRHAEDIDLLKTSSLNSTRMLAEHSITLSHIAATLDEVKDAVRTTSDRVGSLTVAGAVLRSKVTWLVAILLFVANMFGASAGKALLVALDSEPPPTINQPLDSGDHR